MRTEQDIRPALLERANELAAAESATTEPAAPSRRPARRWLPLVAVAATVTCVAGVSAVVADGSHRHAAQRSSTPPSHRTPPATSPHPSGSTTPARLPTSHLQRGPEFRRSFDVSGIVLTRWGVQPGYQYAFGGGAAMFVFMPNTLGQILHYPDTFVQHLEAGQQIMVGGHSAYAANVDVIDQPNWGGATTPTVATVGWEYAPGAWAIVQSTESSAVARHVAAAVRLGTRPPAPVPFTVGSLPKGFVQRYGLDTIPGADGTVDVTYAVAGTPPIPTLPDNGGLEITSETMLAGGLGSRLTIDGRPAGWDEGSHTLTVQVGDHWWVAIMELAPGTTFNYRYHKADLVKVAQSMQFAASLDDISTWFDAAKALP